MDYTNVEQDDNIISDVEENELQVIRYKVTNLDEVNRILDGDSFSLPIVIPEKIVDDKTNQKIDNLLKKNYILEKSIYTVKTERNADKTNAKDEILVVIQSKKRCFLCKRVENIVCESNNKKTEWVSIEVFIKNNKNNNTAKKKKKKGTQIKQNKNGLQENNNSVYLGDKWAHDECFNIMDQMNFTIYQNRSEPTKILSYLTNDQRKLFAIISSIHDCDQFVYLTEFTKSEYVD